MKLRHKNVCQTCRDHKIGCDGIRPSCSQCRHTGRECAGYSVDLEFVSVHVNSRQFMNGPRKSNKRRKNASQGIFPVEVLDQEQRTRNGQFYLTRTPLPALQDAVNIIVRSYVPNNELPFLTQAEEIQPRICGGWVTTLPHLIVDCGKYTVLPAAIETLALSIASKKAQHTVKYATLWQSYGSTLRLLRQSLLHGHGKFDCEHLAASMCLTLTELLISTPTNDGKIHINGVGSMFRSIGPEFFAQGVPHKLFVGFRPLLVLQSIVSRSTSFIAHESWKTIPFQFMSSSPMQELLTEAVNIPFVLEQFDLLPTRPSGSTQTHNNALQDEFRVLLKRLHSWKATYASKSQGPLYWSYPGDRPPDPDEEIWLWFDNVVVANALTHYWAFTAICLVHIQRLRFATNDFSASSTIQTRAAYVEALSMICRSIPFLFEESHELYGPSSVAFLLSTVVSILNWDEELYGSRITINQNLVEYAKDQGFCWVS